MTDKEFAEKSITLSFEFDRYLVNHPDIAGKIPQGASIVFEIEDDPEFTRKELALARKLKNEGEVFVIVQVQKLLPPFETRLVNPRLNLSLTHRRRGELVPIQRNT